MHSPCPCKVIAHDIVKRDELDWESPYAFVWSVRNEHQKQLILHNCVSRWLCNHFLDAKGHECP